MYDTVQSSHVWSHERITLRKHCLQIRSRCCSLIRSMKLIARSSPTSKMWYLYRSKQEKVEKCKKIFKKRKLLIDLRGLGRSQDYCNAQEKAFTRSLKQGGAMMRPFFEASERNLHVGSCWIMLDLPPKRRGLLWPDTAPCFIGLFQSEVLGFSNAQWFHRSIQETGKHQAM